MPALLLPGLTLCVSPLISLMADQVERARRAGIAAERLTADLHPAERDRVLALAATGQLKLLLVSPERLAVPRFRALLASIRVSLLAIDESHCISEEYSWLANGLLRPPVPYTVPFFISATWGSPRHHSCDPPRVAC